MAGRIGALIREWWLVLLMPVSWIWLLFPPVEEGSSVWPAATLVGVTGVFVTALNVVIVFRLPLLRGFVPSSVSNFVSMFAGLYWVTSHADRQCFNEQALSKLDAVYFTLTTLTTTGFGDIQARGASCRAIVTTQMGLGLVLIGVVLTVAVARSSRRP